MHRPTLYPGIRPALPSFLSKKPDAMVEGKVSDALFLPSRIRALGEDYVTNPNARLGLLVGVLRGQIAGSFLDRAILLVPSDEFEQVLDVRSLPIPPNLVWGSEFADFTSARITSNRPSAPSSTSSRSIGNGVGNPSRECGS